MKVTYLLVLLLSSYNLSAQQTYTFDKEFIYKLSYNPDTTNRELVNTESMELLVNDSLSIFRSVKQAQAEEATKQSYLSGSEKIFLGGRFGYNLIKTSDKISHLEFHNGFKKEVMSYTESTSLQEWNILEEEENVNGYDCQAAGLNYGGRAWKAYFTPEIPIMDGPYKFKNLPGLIVKITSDDGTWDFTLESVRQNVKKEAYINQYPKRKVQLMDKKTFYKEIQYYRENSVQIREAKGEVYFPDKNVRDSVIESVKNSLKTNNNMLEKGY